MHDNLRVGQVLEISPPRNNFPLCESAVGTVFIAGGIGVTPFLSMAQRLNEIRRHGPCTTPFAVRTGLRTWMNSRLLRPLPRAASR